MFSAYFILRVAFIFCLGDFIKSLLLCLSWLVSFFLYLIILLLLEHIKVRGLQVIFTFSSFWLIILLFIFDDETLDIFLPLLGPICREYLFSFSPLPIIIFENVSSIATEDYFTLISLLATCCWFLADFSKIL